MRRKRLSLAKRRHKELRSFAGAPLRRFLAKCQSRYHFSIWHMIKRRARADQRNGLQRSKKPGDETRNMWRAFGRWFAGIMLREPFPLLAPQGQFLRQDDFV